MSRFDRLSDIVVNHSDTVPTPEVSGDQSDNNSEEPVPPKLELSEDESQALRAEKLQTIRQLVESRQYDSDELLQKSIEIMVERIKEQQET